MWKQKEIIHLSVKRCL